MISVNQISIARFHHFHLARQLERHGMLGRIFTGYPRFKLRDEPGIPQEKIRTFPWLQAPYMFAAARGFSPRILREWAWWAHETLDWHVASRLQGANVLFALSGSGLNSARAIHRQGGFFICDRGSSHIRYQDEILSEEYRRWGRAFRGVDPRMICKEEAEYAEADAITVPSEFVRRSFIQKGVAAGKLHKVPYGARLERFRPLAEPDDTEFVVLFVGQVTLRKGFPYLVEAFRRLRHPGKRLKVIGHVPEETREMLRGTSLDQIEFLGSVPNNELAMHYSRAHVFALPSIEEGLSLVMGEAMACGCPVVASTNTGAEDLFDDGVEGFITSARDIETMTQRLQKLADDPGLRAAMSAAAVSRARRIGGWDAYGDGMADVLRGLTASVLQVKGAGK